MTLAGKKSRDSNDKATDTREWSEKVREKYNKVHEVVLDNLPGMWPILEFVLSVKSILNIRGCNLPFSGIILGPPGSLKTATIQLFRGYKYSFYTDSFTAKALVSHNSGVSEKKLKQIDMLPKIKDRLFLTPELAPIFSSRDEDLLQVLGTLTRVADGQGYESDTGSQGHRGYSEHMMFTWIGASVEIPFKVHKHLAVLGPRLYFFRQPREVHTEDDYLFYCQNVSDNFTERLDKIRFALYEYLAYFELHPNIEQQQPEGVVEDADEDDDDDEAEGNAKGNKKRKAEAKTKRIIVPPPPKIPFTGKSPEEVSEKETIDIYLIRLAELLARLRAIVPTWHTRDTQGSDYGYSVAIIEEPNRAITQLRNLARGHALSQGRDYITIDDDIPLLIKVVLSTASIERSLIFDILIANDGVLTTSQICEYLNTSKPTALRTMTELKAVGLVDMCEDTGYHDTETSISLKPEFNWFLTHRFEELKQNERKEKYPPHKAPCLPNLLYQPSVVNKVLSSSSVVGESSLRSDETNDGPRGGENSLQSNSPGKVGDLTNREVDSKEAVAKMEEISSAIIKEKLPYGGIFDGNCKYCDLSPFVDIFEHRQHLENVHQLPWKLQPRLYGIATNVSNNSGSDYRYEDDKPPPRPPMWDSTHTQDYSQSVDLCHCHPFVKWAGGKGQLLSELDSMVPSQINRYFEPFLGGGAMFFNLVSDRNMRFTAYLSDINQELITAYNVIKVNPKGVVELLQVYDIGYKKYPPYSEEQQQYYYQLRDAWNKEEFSSNVERAAMFIALNRTCFNGLYRVNKEGEFNVPPGKYKNPLICDSSNLENISNVLRYSNAVIQISDYKEALLNAKNGDFIYLDPPYFPMSSTANFTGYTDYGFGNKDQSELAKIFIELNDRGCKVLLSNSDTYFIRRLYSDFSDYIKEVNVSRSINSKASRRIGHKELLISNYSP